MPNKERYERNRNETNNQSNKVCNLPDEGRGEDEAKPGIDMVNSKADELEGKTAMKLVQQIRIRRRIRRRF